MTTAPPGNYPPNYGSAPPPAPQRKTPWGWIAGGIGALVALILIIVIVVVATNDDDDKTPTPVPVPTVTAQPVPTTQAPEPTPEPTTAAPVPDPTTLDPTSPQPLETPSYVRTESLYQQAFIQAIRNDGEWGPASRTLSDKQLLTLGTATCVILHENNGDLVDTVKDVVSASNDKIPSKNAAFLVGAAAVGLCPTVTITTK